MVSRDEVEDCGLLPCSKSPVFVHKWSKLCHFWPKMTQNERLSDFSPNYVLLFPNFAFNIICNTLEL